MKHLDIFSGIGGFSLSSSWVWGDDHEIVAFVEIDKFCQKVLKKHWPDVPIIEDIRDCNYEKIMAYADTTKKYAKEKTNKRGEQEPNNGAEIRDIVNSGCETRTTTTKIDLLTGGFPCQPFSVAGKQRGAKDDRFLWPEMLRVIREVQPTWVIAENVPGIVRMELDGCISDLETSGYAVQSFIIPACAVDAPHRRDRVWIVGNAKEQPIHDGRDKRAEGETQVSKFGNTSGKATMGHTDKPRSQGHGRLQQRAGESVAGAGSEDVANTKNANDTNNTRRQRKMQSGGSGGAKPAKWEPEPNVGRVANGISRRVDRLRSLGNAIVPQAVVPIMQAIKDIDKTP